MTSNKPYLLRALYEWITDNPHDTPYIQVEASVAGVKCPHGTYVKDNQIVLNIAMQVGERSYSR